MKMLRTVLRKLGIELTVYWAGTFVGPQIAKLMHESRYKFIWVNLRATFETMVDQLTPQEIEHCRDFLVNMEGVFDVYFELLRLVKVPNMINSKDISSLLKKKFRIWQLFIVTWSLAL